MAYLRGWSGDGRRFLYLRHCPASSSVNSALASLDLAERNVITLVSDPRLQFGYMDWSSLGACFTGARLIYSLREPYPDNNSNSNLWELPVNPGTGEPAGNPRKITHWTGTNSRAVNASADGKTLSILKENAQTDAYVGELDANGTRLKTPRRLTLDERFDRPGPWMPDSKAIVFTSNRNGTWDIFKQAIDQSSAELLVSGDVKLARTVTPDGAWLIYMSQTKEISSGRTRLMRVSVVGGPPEPVVGVGALDDFMCAKRLHPPRA
jgi:Tol biopolymer transport system component